MPDACSTPGLPAAPGASLAAQVPRTLSAPGLDARSLPYRVDTTPGMAPFDVLGPDDRQQVHDARLPPWCMVCHLVVQNDRGQFSSGTGWLAGPDTVITAAHVLHDASLDHRAQHVTVYPGRVGSTALAEHQAVGWAWQPGWAGAQPPGQDIAVVRTQGAPGRRWGWFGFRALSSAELLHRQVRTAGYPDHPSLPPGSLLWCEGEVAEVTHQLLRYALDTQPGQSGSPVYHPDAQGLPVALGVHAYGSPLGNHAVRLTPELVEQLKAWFR